MMKSDPAIDHVRQVRHEISARFNHDPRKLTAYYMERQKRHAGRLVYSNPPAASQPEDKASGAQRISDVEA